MEAIQEAGREVALDHSGNTSLKIAPYLEEPVYVERKDSFIAAFPSSDLRITYGIDFPQVWLTTLSVWFLVTDIGTLSGLFV